MELGGVGFIFGGLEELECLGNKGVLVLWWVGFGGEVAEEEDWRLGSEVEAEAEAEEEFRLF